MRRPARERIARHVDQPQEGPLGRFVKRLMPPAVIGKRDRMDQPVNARMRAADLFAQSHDLLLVLDIAHVDLAPLPAAFADLPCRAVLVRTT